MYLSCFFRLELKSLHKSQNLDWGEGHELRYSQGSIFVKEHVQQGQKGHYGARVKNVPRASINICLPHKKRLDAAFCPQFSLFLFLSIWSKQRRKRSYSSPDAIFGDGNR